jgi:hypothetical protein
VNFEAGWVVRFNQIPVHFLTPQTPEMIISYKTPALFFSALASSDAFSISRRAFLVDTTISCSALVQKSWIPQAVDNKKEDAIHNVIMLFGDRMHSKYTHLAEWLFLSY